MLEDNLSARLSVDHFEFAGDTIIDLVGPSATGNRAHQQDGTTIRGSILFEPESFSDLSVYLIAERIETFSRNPNLVTSPGPLGSPEEMAFDPFGGVGFQIPNEDDTETNRISAQISYNINDYFSVFSLLTYEDTFEESFSGDELEPGLFPFSFSFDSDTQTKSAEVRLEYVGDKLTGRVGAYFFNEDALIDGRGLVEIGSFIPVVPATAIASIGAELITLTENYAFFTEWRYEPNDPWAFELGLRYDNEENLNPGVTGTVEVDPPDCVVADFVPGLGGFPCASILPAAEESQDQNVAFDAWLPRAAVIYNITDSHSVSFIAQRGYRAGGSFLFVDRDSDQQAPSLETFGAEFLTNYELSFRTQWFDDALTVNANVYHSDWTDQQVTIAGPTGFNDSRTLNIGESELNGLELELQWYVHDNFEIFATFGLSDTEFLDFPFGVDEQGQPFDPVNPEFANLAGNEFQANPGVTASAGAYYKFNNGVFVDFNLNYTGDGYSDVFNLESDATDAYTITNVRIGYNYKNWRFFAYANNLFDERAITESNFENVVINTDEDSQERSIGITQFDTPFTRVNRARVIGVAIEYRY